MRIAVSQRLAELQLCLPELPTPRGSYSGSVIHHGIAYVSGQMSREGTQVILGPVTWDTPDDQLEQAAKACVLNALSTLNGSLGSLELLDRILFLRGFVYSVPSFDMHSHVLDLASDLLHDIFGERGRHARSAVGVAILPSGGLLEIEIVAAIT